jgi:hypothetical protein
MDGHEGWMQVEGTSECSEHRRDHEPGAAMPEVNAEGASGGSRRRHKAAEGLDERVLQEAEERLEAIRHG